MNRNYNVEKQHQKQKYHAYERILLLLDRGSFREIGGGINNYEFNGSPWERMANWYMKGSVIP